MATRATIKIEGFNLAKVYKHWDGYPEATAGWLVEFNKMFVAKRGTDPNYKFAQLLRSSVFLGKKHNLDTSDTTGWGVVAFDESWGEEYEYTLMNDGSIVVKE